MPNTSIGHNPTVNLSLTCTSPAHARNPHSPRYSMRTSGRCSTGSPWLSHSAPSQRPSTKSVGAIYCLDVSIRVTHHTIIVPRSDIFCSSQYSLVAAKKSAGGPLAAHRVLVATMLLTAICICACRAPPPLHEIILCRFVFPHANTYASLIELDRVTLCITASSEDYCSPSALFNDDVCVLNYPG